MEIMVWLALIVFFVVLEIATVGLICSGIICTALFYKTMGTEIFETASGQDKL